MNTQDMVFAEKFILARVNGKWDKNTRTSKGVKLIPRQWAEDRNAQDNNEYYAIDEERSKGITEARQANAIKNAERRKRKEVSQGDIVEALAAAIKGSDQEKSKTPRPRNILKKEVQKNMQEEIELTQEAGGQNEA